MAIFLFIYVARKRTLLLNNLIALVCAALQGCSKSAASFEMLIAGRIIGGVCCGKFVFLCSQHCDFLFVCLFVWLVGFLTSLSTTRLYRGRAPIQERLTILRAATHETELGNHDFCLSRSHYTDTDPTCRERAATAGIEPGTSSPGVVRSSD